MSALDSADTVPAIELRGLCKSFGGLAANSDISLQIPRGSIHAIIGENGAGKSTAMKILYGIYRPDSGEILVDGRAHQWRSPADAIAAGIGMVHQHFMLAGPYSALDNIILGSEPLNKSTRWLPRFLRPVDRENARARLVSLSKLYGLNVNLDSAIEDLSVGIQQRIEILKLLYREARVLILDEPTAVLTPQETTELFANLRRLCAEGKTVIIITHKLKEVMQLADQVTVFRAGRVTGEVAKAETSVEELASLMVGRHVHLNIEAPPAPLFGAPALEVKGVTLAPSLQELDFEVRGGEVVGIAGVEGNGQSELLQLLAHPADYAALSQGVLRILGEQVLGGGQGANGLEIKKLGVGVIPEDRHREGLLLERPVRENFLLGLQRFKPFNNGGFISYAALNEEAGHALEEYDVRPRSLEICSGRLSGGNQQKIIIAREFSRKPGFLIAAQPTRGVDVGAIEFIHRRILRARAEGAGILLVSSELDEILTLSDRILVMYHGKIVAQFKRGEGSEAAIGVQMGGGKSA